MSMVPATQSRKRKSSEYVADNGFIDDDSDGAGPQTKRTKPASSSSLLRSQKDDSGDLYWELTKMRRVTISEFKGKQMVGIREYYEQNGKILPGKKVRNVLATGIQPSMTNERLQGISMPVDQFSAFVELLPQIEKELAKKGEKVPRPQYDGVKKEEDVKQELESDDDGGNSRPKRSNIEATSDEDEDD